MDSLESRSPCGERGLKYNRETGKLELHLSLPVRGAWIEILSAAALSAAALSSLPVRGAWIEIDYTYGETWRCWSLPVRGAWIEIVAAIYASDSVTVAPRAGSVD